MRSDDEIRRDVEAELRWDPEISATDIAVAVQEGVVTLVGFVRRYYEKYAAEAAAARVAGVLGVANDIEVRLPDTDERLDPEIARAAIEAIRAQIPIALENIQVLVEGGVVTLEGAVEWQFQRQAAENIVRRLKGVRDVINLIQLKPKATPTEIKRQIEAALRRSAELDASRITVETRDGEIILRGSVRSWAEREVAERAAWAAPGITKMDNRITVSP